MILNNLFDKKFVKFIITGVISNTISFLIFLFAIYVVRIGHKTAATLLFMVGMTVNYLVNKKWTFNTLGSMNKTLAKYLLTYFFGYFINMGILYFFVDYLDYQAGWVQFFAIGFLVIYYFLLNKYFVFRA